MKPALHLRLHQQLALTPQLQQAIRLLQLSSVELEMELREALESNPLLELPEEVPPEPVEADNSTPNSHEYEHAAQAADGAAQSNEERVNGDDSYEPMDGDFSLGSRSSSSSSNNNDDDDNFETQEAERQDLRDHLLWQLNLTPMSPRDNAIATSLIESVEDDGYLHEPIEAIQESLRSLFEVEADEIEAVRHRVQRFDPLGVASRTLSECLGVQLEALDQTIPGVTLARAIVAEHLETLAKNERGRIARTLRASPEDVDIAVHVIRSLDPKPGSSIGAGPPEYVAPDAYAFRQGGRWNVSLAAACQPRLGINRLYESLIARAQRDDASYLRGQLQEARWLIKSLKTRAETILKVAQSIVKAQSAFLDFGPEAMKPLVLKDVAEQIGMHESTVSRVTTRKFLYTPRGTFEFKYFFSSGVSTVDGGSASSTAIQAMIRKLIGDETPARPMSDQALAEELNRRGISVARRTVAKYREALHIPSSNDRCRLA